MVYPNTVLVLRTQAPSCHLGVRPIIPFRYADGMSNLRALRENRGLSQQQLAEKVVPPTSQPQIDRLEKSQRKLTKEWAVRLSRALECHWLELMADDIPILTEQEKAVVDLYRGLSEPDKCSVFRHLDALAKSNADHKPKHGHDD